MAPSRIRTTGFLAVRVWVEDHPTRPLRVVISSYVDLGNDDRVPDRQATVTSIEEASSLVREWLKELLDDL